MTGQFVNVAMVGAPLGLTSPERLRQHCDRLGLLLSPTNLLRRDTPPPRYLYKAFRIKPSRRFSNREKTSNCSLLLACWTCKSTVS